MKAILYLAAVIFAITSLAVLGRSTSRPGMEAWGYIEVRPGAFMFYWLYYTTATVDYTQTPWIIWLDGGPGGTSSGCGNFQLIGLRDLFLQKRKYSWVHEANVLFIDSPVGSGYSYVNETKLIPTNNELIASDLCKMLIKFFKKFPDFRTMPLYVVGESYGGKMAPEFTLKLYQQIQAKKIKCDLKGVVILTGLVSMLNQALTFALYLYSMSLLDSAGFDEVNDTVNKLKVAYDKGQFTEAYELFNEVLITIGKLTNGVDMLDLLGPYSVTVAGPCIGATSVKQTKSKNYGNDILLPPIDNIMSENEITAVMEKLMNGPIRKRLRIISKNKVFYRFNCQVHEVLTGDMVKPVIHIVEKLLLDTDLVVNFWNGQTDGHCNILGTSEWVETMKWPGITKWKNAPKKSISLNNSTTAFFVKSHQKFSFYWVLNAGHVIPDDQPEVAFHLIKFIINPKTNKKLGPRKATSII